MDPLPLIARLAAFPAGPALCRRGRVRRGVATLRRGWSPRAAAAHLADEEEEDSARAWSSCSTSVRRPRSHRPRGLGGGPRLPPPTCCPVPRALRGRARRVPRAPSGAPRGGRPRRPRLVPALDATPVREHLHAGTCTGSPRGSRRAVTCARWRPWRCTPSPSGTPRRSSWGTSGAGERGAPRACRLPGSRQRPGTHRARAPAGRPGATLEGRASHECRSRHPRRAEPRPPAGGAQPASTPMGPTQPLRPGSSLTAGRARDLFEDMVLSRSLDVAAREPQEAWPGLLHHLERGPRAERLRRCAAADGRPVLPALPIRRPDGAHAPAAPGARRSGTRCSPSAPPRRTRPAAAATRSGAAARPGSLPRPAPSPATCPRPGRLAQAAARLRSGGRPPAAGREPAHRLDQDAPSEMRRATTPRPSPASTPRAPCRKDNPVSDPLRL